MAVKQTPIMYFVAAKRGKIHLTGGKLEPGSQRSWCGLVKNAQKFELADVDDILQETDEWTDYCLNCIWSLMYEDVVTVERFSHLQHHELGVMVVDEHILQPLLNLLKQSD